MHDLRTCASLHQHPYGKEQIRICAAAVNASACPLKEPDSIHHINTSQTLPLQFASRYCMMTLQGHSKRPLFSWQIKTGGMFSLAEKSLQARTIKTGFRVGGLTPPL